MPILRAHGGAAAKRVGYSNPEVDKLLDEGIAEQDVAERTERLRQDPEICWRRRRSSSNFSRTTSFPASAAVKDAAPHGVYIIQLRYATKEAAS